MSINEPPRIGRVLWLGGLEHLPTPTFLEVGGAPWLTFASESPGAKRRSAGNLEGGGGEVSWLCKAMAATLFSEELAQEDFYLQIRMPAQEC